MRPFVIVLIPYINLLNLSRIIKSIFLRNVEPLKEKSWLPLKANFSLLKLTKESKQNVQKNATFVEIKRQSATCIQSQ